MPGASSPGRSARIFSTIAGQPRAFGFVLDPARQRDAGRIGHQDQQPAGDRDVGRKPRALVADRVLDHLDQDLVPFAHVVGDLQLAVFIRVRIVTEERGPRTRLAGGEEPCPLEPDIDEGGLHRGQHALHAAEKDVADEVAARRRCPRLARLPPSSRPIVRSSHS